MELKDSFGRKFDYLRISLTDRCNLRCFYCMPEEGIKLFKKKEILTLEEIEYIVFLFYKNFNIRKVRFTGGEPLLRRGFEKLIEDIRKNFPEIDLNITTNGILLKERAEFLKEKKIKVNVSLDTLKKEKFREITGFDYIEKIIEGIDYALNLKIPLKINTVVLKSINDDEILDLIDFAGKRNIPIRFIEYMPLSGNGEWKRYFFSEEEIKKKIKERYELVPVSDDSSVATTFRLRKNKQFIAQIGFISTISNPFCNTCSRLRITADGKIILCLFDKNGYDIKKFLRPEIREKELLDFLLNTVKLKPEGFIGLKDKFLDSKTVSKPFAVMRKVGG